jgi:hypothetical protein
MKPAILLNVGNVMKRHLLIGLVVSAVLAGACRRFNEADPIPASVPGTYVYAAKGATLRKPWEVFARLELRSDKRFTLTFDKTIEGKRDPTETSDGQYAVSGDRILLHEGRGPLKSTQDEHKLVIKADSLVAEVGWTVELLLKGLGAPNIVFVREHRS